MASARRIRGKGWGFLLLGAGVVTAAIPLAAAGLSLSWDRGFVTRTPLPNYSRVRLPEATALEIDPNLPADEIAKAIAESAQEVTTISAPEPTPAPAPALAASAGRVPATKQSPTPFLQVDFDVLAPGGKNTRVSGDAITVRKTVRMGGKELGSLPVHVDGESRLLVEASEVRGLLERAGVSGSVPGSGMVSLSDLRRSGIDLRYDPTSDALRLGTR